jgi:hypothetical protein
MENNMTVQEVRDKYKDKKIIWGRLVTKSNKALNRQKRKNKFTFLISKKIKNKTYHLVYAIR